MSRNALMVTGVLLTACSPTSAPPPAGGARVAVNGARRSPPPEAANRGRCSTPS